ncbi:MAG: protein kinase [Planctomycetes bacterium]|nr:protein kinase [Planctomycetota bacterium]
MNPAQWAAIRELFAEARKLSQELREPFLLSSSNDEVVLTQVRTLLNNDQEDDFLEDPALGNAFTLADAQTPEQGMQVPVNLIDGYTISKILGSGASGIVYEAQQSEPKRMVAIKVLRAGSMGKNDRVRFQREAETLANLEHQHVATVHAIGTTSDGSPWMAMELIVGQRLDDWAQDKGSNDIVSIMQKISDAVHAAHCKNIVHRDLKPANILVDEDGHPRVLDFGVARITKGDNDKTTLITQTGAIIGTQKYMSPEQASGSPNVDARSDVYAMGIMLQEFLPNNAPRDLRTIAAKAADEFSNRRYLDGGELRDDLQRWSDKAPIHARRSTPWYVATLLIRRHKAISSFIALVVIVIVLAISDVNTKDRAHYFSLIQQAQLAFEQSDLTQMNQLLNLCDENHRNWEWHWLHQLAIVGELPIKAIDVSATNGANILATTANGELVRATTNHVIRQHPFSTSRSLLSRDCSTWVAMQQNGTLVITAIESPENEPLVVELGVPYTHISCMSLSEDGNYLIVAMTPPFNPEDPSSLIAKTQVLCLDLQNPSVLFEEALHDRILDNDSAIAVSNEGNTAVVSMIDGSIIVWRHGEIEDRRSIKITNGAATVALSTEGNMLAVGGIGAGVTNIRLLDSNTLSQIADIPIIAHDYAVLSIDIAPDISKVVSIDTSGILRISPLDGGTPSSEVSREKESGVTVKFSSDSNHVLIRSANGNSRIRPTLNVSTEKKLFSTGTIVQSVILNDLIYITKRDGSSIKYNTKNNTTSVVDSISYRTLEPTISSPDNSRHITIEQKTSVQLWDSKTQTPLISLPWAGNTITSIGFINDGNAIIAISIDGKLKKWTTQQQN